MSLFVRFVWLGAFSRDWFDSSVACVCIVSSRAIGYVLTFAYYIVIGALYLCLASV